MNQLRYDPGNHITLETPFGYSNAIRKSEEVLSVLHSFIPPEERNGIIDRPVLKVDGRIYPIRFPAPSVGDRVDVYYRHPIYGTIGRARGVVVSQKTIYSEYGDVVVSEVAVPVEGLEEIYREAIKGVVGGRYVGVGKYGMLELEAPFMPFPSLSGSPAVKDGNISGVVSRILYPLGTDPDTALAYLPQPMLPATPQGRGMRRWKHEPNVPYILLETVS